MTEASKSWLSTDYKTNTKYNDTNDLEHQHQLINFTMISDQWTAKMYEAA